MGISCEINLELPPNGEFVAGTNVSGNIRYAVDEDTVFSKITLSLKGIGEARLIERRGSTNNSGSSDYTYKYSEAYVDIDEVILENTDKEKLCTIGSYETKFNFAIPTRIPPTVKIVRRESSKKLKYVVKYYIRIKFERPGLFSFTKRFKKDLNIVSDVLPVLPREPVIFGEEKKILLHVFAKNPIINIKAILYDSVVKAGERVKFDYEITNNSKVKIKYVEIYLMEVVELMKRKKSDSFSEILADTKSKTASIKGGDTQKMEFEVKLPESAVSIDSCSLVSRGYVIYIHVVLPVPYINFGLKIPFQIQLRDIVYDASPPDYWEVMNEDKVEK